MTSVAVSTIPAMHRLWRFLRTPKGLLLVIFVGLLAAASPKLGSDVVTNVIIAAVTAAAIDLGFTYWRRRQWVLPDGAVLTGMIVAFVLRPEESWSVLVAVVALAILSKHLLRTHWSNIFNPAAFALVVAAIALHAGQSWWGALPDLGVPGTVAVLGTGIFIAHRINKLPMILAFGGAYFTLLTVASFVDSSAVAETFRTPDLQAALFFAFFMLDDPPTSPVRHEDQIVFGVIVGSVAYFVYKQFGGIYYLPVGLLAGNVWESARRLVVGRIRTGVVTLTLSGHRLQYNVPSSEIVRTLRVVSSAAAAVVAVVLLVSASVAGSRSAPDAIGSEVAVEQPTPVSSVPPSSGSNPFLASFNAKLTGTYTQTTDGRATDLTIDALTSGDLVLKMHIELSTTGGSAGTQGAVSVNKAQLSDPGSGAVVCDGKLTAFNANLVRAACAGAGPYSGDRITFAPNMQSDSPTTVTGTVTGTMEHTS